MSSSPEFSSRSRWASRAANEPDVVFDEVAKFRDQKRHVVTEVGQPLGKFKANLTIGEPRERGPLGEELAWTSPIYLTKLCEVAQLAKGRELGLGYGTSLGHAEFRAHISQRIFGAGSPLLEEGRVATVQTAGGTNALHLALALALEAGKGGPVWTSEPGWGNYPGIIRKERRQHFTVPHRHGGDGHADVQPLLDAFGTRSIRQNHTVILQSDGHNPTGWLFPDAAWSDIAQKAKESGCFVVLDVAYDGLIRGPVKDRQAIDAFVEAGVEFAVAYSCSKNFGIGGMRLGALSLNCRSTQERDVALRELGNANIRPVVSHPSPFPAEIAVRVYRDQDALTAQDGAVERKSSEIGRSRAAIIAKLRSSGVDVPEGGFGPFITLPRGDAPFIAALKEFGVHTVGSRAFVVVDEPTMDYAVRGIQRAMDEVPLPKEQATLRTSVLPSAGFDGGSYPGAIGPVGGGC